MVISIENIKRGTTIDQIVVPDKLRLRYPFHTELNERLRFVTNLYGGLGITPSTVTLLTGTPGSGKSTLLMQMAHALHTRNDAFVLFNGGEESLYQTKMVTERLFKTKNPSFYVGQDTIVDSSNPDLHPKLKGIAKSGNLRSILGHMEYLMAKNPSKHPILMLDSLQSFDDGKYADGYVNGQTPHRVLKLINKFCKTTFCSAIIIGQVTKDGDPAGANKVIHDIDVLIHMFIDTKNKSETQGMRIIQTKKNRYGYSGQAHILSMYDDGVHEEGALLSDE